MDEVINRELSKFHFMGRHLRKRARKFVRRTKPLIRRLERARATLDRIKDQSHGL